MEAKGVSLSFSFVDQLQSHDNLCLDCFFVRCNAELQRKGTVSLIQSTSYTDVCVIFHRMHAEI